MYKEHLSLYHQQGLIRLKTKPNQINLYAEYFLLDDQTKYTLKET